MRSPRRTDDALSTQERTLLRLAALGQTHEEAAQALRLTTSEVEAALRLLQTRLGVPTEHALIARAVVHRWI